MVTDNTNTTDHKSPRERLALFMPHLDVLAHTGRSLLVARSLKDAGCRVVFAGAGKYAGLVRNAGFEVAPLPEMPTSQLVSQSKRGKRWPFHSAEQIRPFIQAELQLFSRLKPNIVVFDHRYTAGISAEIALVSRVSITNLWWTPYDATGMGLAETHPLFVACPALLFLKRFKWADRMGNRLAQSMFRRWIRPYNTVRAEHGQPPLSSILDLFAADAVILPDTPELTPAVDLPPSHHYVGPLVWEPEGHLPDQLQASPEYIYVSMGSSADPAVFDTVVEALSLLPDAPAVVTTGGVRRVEEFASAAAHIRFYDFLPGSAAAKGASLVVCQGGIGTIYQALAAGKPLLAVPFMPEQEVYGIGAVQRLGAGVTVSKRHLDAQKLAAAIDSALHDESLKAAAARLAAKLDLASPPQKAAQIVLDLLQ